MVTSSKILTVSYGTFSCTLEGFDDPFTTLQQVAEYFRKLAAADRYFGGTPQTPSTEMLKEIAARNSRREVDAMSNGNGVVLRQTDKPVSAEPAPAMEPAPAEAPAPEARAESKPEPKPLTVFPAAAESAPAEPAPAASGPSRSVQETLAAIRHNVEQAETEIAAHDHPEAEPDPETFALAGDAEADPAVSIAARLKDIEVAELPPLDTTGLRVFELDADPTADPTDDSPEAAVGEDWIFEDATDAPMPETDDLSAYMDALAEAVADNEAGVSPPDQPETATDEDAIAAEAAETPERDAARPKADAYKSPLISSLTVEQELELARDLAEAMAANPERDEDFLAAATRREERRDRAANLREQGDADQSVERLMAATRTKMERPELIRRVDTLGHLKAAVAATEADSAYRNRRAGQDKKTDETSELENFRNDYSRVKTPERLARPSGGGTPRPPAAPLILVSEQRIDNARGGELREAAFVRQTAGAEVSGNLALQRQIKLAEDFASVEDEIQGIPADAFSAADFSEFAERVGAFEMHDLLEASAAFTAIIEGRERFARADVMNQIAALNHGDGYSKEIGLRAFGKLLGEGKLLRSEDGLFSLSRSSRYSIASRDAD